ncbi:MAG: PQQ-binding-like beta-propeller repeat protein [bacterium]|nr:PQQ-binding-like beta-propeller repeat protein [bacterium]
MQNRFWIVLIAAALAVSTTARADNWPMWRYDAARSAASPGAIARELSLSWTRDYPAQKTTWDDPLNQDLMHFDRVFEPIVLGKTMYIGFNALDRVAALDTETGDERWTFFTDGPVRLPLAGADGKVFAACDDGFLYCLNAKDGSLLWKYRPAPIERRILGNQRLISTWSMRGGPVVKDGVVYAAAGIWPMMGVFLFALDAETGGEIWVNDGVSADYMNQPHNSPSFAGVAPQGALALNGDDLFVPGGRSVPACFDAKTGDLRYYKLAESGKTGGAFTCAIGDFFINYHRDSVVSLYDARDGSRLVSAFGKVPVVTPQALYSRGEQIQAWDFTNFGEERRERITKDRTGAAKVVMESVWRLDPLWAFEADARGDLIEAGGVLYAGGEGSVSAVDTSNGTPVLLWTQPVEGKVERLIAADGKLFAVTLEGRIYAFSERGGHVKKHPFITHGYEPNDDDADKARSILDAFGVRDGYALVLNAKRGAWIESLLNESELHLIAASDDEGAVNDLRRRFGEAGLYGERFAALKGDAVSLNAPAYFASLIVYDDARAEDFSDESITALYQCLRPYGGIACFEVNESDARKLASRLKSANLEGANIERKDGWLTVTRKGALPGADDWTHNYGDIANTVKSDDSRVQLPLGILWFGGSSNMDVLPRHGHAPSPQVIDGRVFVQGMSSLSARDAYTGRVFWKREFDDLGNYGVYYDDTYAETPLDPSYNQIHIPGANARGTNYAATHDVIYIIEGGKCRMLDPATGEDTGSIELPPFENESEPEKWGYIGVDGDNLIAGAGRVSYFDFIDMGEGLDAKKKPFVNFDDASSKRLVVMDRHSGEVKWTFTSELGIRHNAICAGDGKLYCVDRMPDPVADALKRRGKKFFGTPRLYAFDLETGDVVWSRSEAIFGTWLSYSKEHDLLLEAGRPSRDMIAGEPQGMAAWNAKTGELSWRNTAEYNGPPILHHDEIITDPYAFNLLTGERVMRKNPLTGDEAPWMFTRAYGCNYAIASEYMLTFRSAAAGFFDLASDGGTGNFGGFKSSCTNTLIAADGLLNAPDYTRTCSCPYQNQTSLAMIHDPGVEIWTYNHLEDVNGPIQRVGVNLGAPGDRRADGGTLWLEYPFEGGPTPELEIEAEPDGVAYFRHHSARMNGGAAPWIAASGAKGITRFRIRLDQDGAASKEYAVRLVFSEPEALKPGDRTFDVFLQGEPVLENFDAAAEAGSIRTGVTREFKNVRVSDWLMIELKASASTPDAKPILCGVEVVSNASLAMSSE